MTKNPKILSFADVHLGEYKYPIRPLIEDCLMEVADLAGKLEPDVILFAGDAFRTRVPSARDVSTFGMALRLMAEIAPVIMIPGNHDLAGHNATTIDVYAGYHNVKVMKQSGIYSMGAMQIACMPWLPQKPMVSQGIDEESVRGTIETVIQLLRARIHPDDFNVMLAHASALGNEFSTGISTMLGHDVLWPSEWFDGFDLCILGHLHKPAQVVNAPHAWYTGSLCPVSFNETGHAKAVLWYDGEKVEYIMLQASPLFVQVDAKQVQAAVDEYQEYEEDSIFLQVIKDADAPDPEIPGNPAWYEIVNRPPKRETRQRIDSEEAQSLSVLDAIERYLQLENQEEMVKPVCELAQELIENTE